MADTVDRFCSHATSSSINDFTTFLQHDVTHFIEHNTVTAFVHILLTNLLTRREELQPHDADRFAAAFASDIHPSWHFPVSLALLELRYITNTLSQLTSEEIATLIDFYGINDSPYTVMPEYVNFYACGTTSIILQAHQEYALKLVRPLYLTDNTICSLDKYRRDYSDIPYGPRLYYANRSMLVMELIRGPTLDVYVTSLVEKSPSSQVREQKRSLIKQLAHVVSRLHQNNHAHGDLNPRNIIVSTDTNHIRLIDFGYNHSLSRPLLTQETYSAARRYFLPADANRNLHDDDLYLQSMLALDIWTGFLEKDATTLLDLVALEAPEFGLVIEAGLAQNAEMRRAAYTAFPSEARFSAEMFDTAITFSFEAMDQRSHDPSVLRYLIPDMNIFRHWEDVGPQNQYTFVAEKTVSRRLARVYRIAYALSATLGSLIVLLTISTALFDEPNWFDWLEAIRQCWKAQVGVITADFAAPGLVIPGYAVCLSFLIVANKYYGRLFSTVVARGGKQWSRRTAEWSMRANAVCYLLPISFCTLLDPAAWPFGSAVGVLFTGINNLCVSRALTEIRGHPRFEEHALERSAAMERMYDYYRGWARLIFYYVGGLVVVGIVIVTSTSSINVVVDLLFGERVKYNTFEWLFAVIVVAINYLKMQRENCGRYASVIRSMIQRHFEAGRALNKLVGN